MNFFKFLSFFHHLCTFFVKFFGHRNSKVSIVFQPQPLFDLPLKNLCHAVNLEINGGTVVMSFFFISRLLKYFAAYISAEYIFNFAVLCNFRCSLFWFGAVKADAHSTYNLFWCGEAESWRAVDNTLYLPILDTQFTFTFI